MGNARKLADLHDHMKADTNSTISALRLQAKAWRICALICLSDQTRGTKLIQWLLFKTVPWVDGESLTKFIDENYDAAETAGHSFGVFSK